MALEHGFVELRRIERAGGRRGALHVIQPMAGIEHRLRHRPVDQAGIEMAQPVMGGEPLAQRALAGGGRSVDGDDHAKSAPNPRICGTKPGKLVAMKLTSSTPTGFSLASPITRNAMAMR